MKLLFESKESDEIFESLVESITEFVNSGYDFEDIKRAVNKLKRELPAMEDYLQEN